MIDAIYLRNFVNVYIINYLIWSILVHNNIYYPALN